MLVLQIPGYCQAKAGSAMDFVRALRPVAVRRLGFLHTSLPMVLPEGVASLWQDGLRQGVAGNRQI
jgi:hypothetical protein